MKTLVIDTSKKTALLGIVEKGQVLDLRFLDHTPSLCTMFFPVLESFCDFSQVQCIGVGIGPGSYMGLRTAAIIGKTLSYVKHLPLLTFCSILAFLPKEVRGSFAFIEDAKMGQFYGLTGVATSPYVVTLSSPELLESHEIPSFLQNKDFIIGEGHFPSSPNLHWVASVCDQKTCEKKFTSPFDLKIDYLRNP